MQFLLFALTADSCAAATPYYVRASTGDLTCYAQCPALFAYAEYSKQCVSKCGSGSFQSIVGEAQALRCVPYCTAKQVAVGQQEQCVDACPSEAPYQVGVECVSRCPAGLNYVSQVDSQCVSQCNAYKNISSAVQELYQCVWGCSSNEYFTLDGNGNQLCLGACPTGLTPKGSHCVKNGRKDRRDAAYSVSGIACSCALLFLLWSCWYGDRAYQSAAIKLAQNMQDTAIPLNKLIGGAAAIAQFKTGGGLSRSLKSGVAAIKADNLNIFVPKKGNHVQMAPQRPATTEAAWPMGQPALEEPPRKQHIALGDIQD